MNTKLSTNRKLKRMFVNILSIVVMLTMAFPATGSAYAEGEPIPWLIAFPENDAVEGWEWPEGATVTLTVNGTTDPDWSGVANVTSWGDPRTYVRIEFGADYNLQVGDVVTLTDEFGTSTTHEVQPLSVTGVDMDTNIVSGTANMGAQLQVWVHGQSEPPVDVTSDGTWQADLTDVHDITYGTGGRSQIMVDGNATAVDWNAPPPPPSPWLTVRANDDRVEAFDWEIGTTLTLEIDDPGIDGAPDYSTTGVVTGPTPWGDPRNYLSFNLAGVFDILPGFEVSVGDGTLTKTLSVTNLTITDIDLNGNVVYGQAAEGMRVDIWPCDNVMCANRHVNAESSSSWAVDFDVPGTEPHEQTTFDIKGGIVIDSGQCDEDGDCTNFSVAIPNPHFTVFPEWEWFDGLDWPDGATMAISVDGKPECSLERESWGGFFNGSFPQGCDIVFGDTVTFADGKTTRTHVVRNLYVMDVNVDENTVSGKADAGSTVYVWPHDGWFEPLQLTANDLGEWQADLDDKGYDIRDDSVGRSEIRDEMGNATASDWHVVHPHFTVFPEWEWFDGNDWPNGAIVNITVANKPECETTKESWNYFFNGSFGEGCNLEVGDTVTFTDGEMIRTHTVQNLAITKANHEDDIVKGTADAGAVIHVWPHATGQEQLAITNPQGKWNVDFTGIYDLMRGDGGRAEIRDEAGNATAVDWYIPNPRVVASITEDWFYLQEFTPNKVVNFTVYTSQGGKPIWKGTATTDGSGFAWIDAEGRWNLEPGNYLVVNDGSNSKDLVIEGFTFDVFNLSNGQLSGTAPSGRNVWVGIGWQDQDAWTMNVTADSGMWLADFGQPVPSDYWWVAAQIFDSDGDASELRPALQIIFLRPSCGDTYTVQPNIPLEIQYGSWVAIGEELANQNAEHLTVELVLNGETVIGEKQPVVPSSEIPCGTPREDAYGVFYVAEVGPLSSGTYNAEVTWSFDALVTDGYDADGDGELEWYGPGEILTREFTIIVP